jgi:hypothetical protein
MLALPIDKMLYIYLLCVHALNIKTITSNLNSLNTFTKETGSNKGKTSKSWIQCDSSCPCGGRPNKNMSLGKLLLVSFILENSV